MISNAPNLFNVNINHIPLVKNENSPWFKNESRYHREFSLTKIALTCLSGITMVIAGKAPLSFKEISENPFNLIKQFSIYAVTYFLVLKVLGKYWPSTFQTAYLPYLGKSEVLEALCVSLHQKKFSELVSNPQSFQSLSDCFCIRNDFSLFVCFLFQIFS